MLVTVSINAVIGAKLNRIVATYVKQSVATLASLYDLYSNPHPCPLSQAGEGLEEIYTNDLGLLYSNPHSG